MCQTRPSQLHNLWPREALRMHEILRYGGVIVLIVTEN